MPSLVFLAGPIAGRRYKLAEGEYIIGRRSDCQIFVPDMRVSRQHARLWQDGEAWQIEDLGSNNGTFVNGEKVEIATPVRHDDEILIANNRIRVEAREAAPDTKPPEGVVTIVDVTGASSLIRSREESGSGRLPIVSSVCAAIFFDLSTHPARKNFSHAPTSTAGFALCASSSRSVAVTFSSSPAIFTSTAAPTWKYEQPPRS